MSTASALLIVDLVGIAVFAASGASAGVVRGLDIFGVVFVGAATALGGGLVRDIVIDVFPPLAFADWRYVAVAVASCLLVFWWHPQFARLRRLVLLLDAAGLGFFTAAGTLKALDFGVPVVGASLIGMITGIGGGLLRDLLTGQIPLVLRREIYALAALAGALGVVLGLRAGVPQGLPLLVCAAALTFLIRMLAIYRNWSAPTAKPDSGTPGAG